MKDMPLVGDSPSVLPTDEGKYVIKVRPFDPEAGQVVDECVQVGFWASLFGPSKASLRETADRLQKDNDYLTGQMENQKSANWNLIINNTELQKKIIAGEGEQRRLAALVLEREDVVRDLQARIHELTKPKRKTTRSKS